VGAGNVSYEAVLRPWQTPRPKMGEYVVDVQWYSEAASIPCKSLKQANKIALGMIPHVGTHAIDVYSVAIYFSGNPK
jgi:hypothetical protein